jgi:benzoylformate decarboxylase
VTIAATVRGVEAMLAQLEAEGVRYVFGNPGTTEQAFVEAVSRSNTLEYVGALHESVAVGAADGFARASRTPAFVQLHAAPGLGNAMGLIYDSAVAHTPLVVYIGEPDSRLTVDEPILGGDALAMARPFAKWVARVEHALALPKVLRRAFKIAAEPPFGVVVVAIPADVLDADVTPERATSARVSWAAAPDGQALTEAAGCLADARAPVILCGDGVAVCDAGEELAALAEELGAPVYEVWTSELALRTDHPLAQGSLNLLAPQTIQRALADHDVIAAFGATLFSLLSVPSEPLIANHQRLVEAHYDSWQLGKNHAGGPLLKGDLKPALAELTRQVRVRRTPTDVLERDRRIQAISSRKRRRQYEARSDGAISPVELAAAIAAEVSAEDVVFDEGITLSGALRATVPRTLARTYFLARGGGLGQGMPGPLGVKLALPERRVLAAVGDGSAVYTVQALWTAARHGIAVVWVIANNGRYHILDRNLAHHLGTAVEEPAFALGPPRLDFASLAQGFGVRAWTVSTEDDLQSALSTALASDEPALVDVHMVDPLT